MWKYIPIHYTKFCIYLMEFNYRFLLSKFWFFFYCWIGEAIIIILIYRIDMLTIWWFGVKQKYRDIIFWSNNLNKNRLNFIENPIFCSYIDLTDYLYIIEITILFRSFFLKTLELQRRGGLLLMYIQITAPRTQTIK